MSYIFLFLGALCLALSGVYLETSVGGILPTAACAFALIAIWFKLDDIHITLKNK